MTRERTTRSRPKPDLPDYPALFRARLERLLTYLEQALAQDHDIILSPPPGGPGEPNPWLSEMEEQRADRPHLERWWYTYPPPPGVVLPLLVGRALELVRDGLNGLAEVMAQQVMDGAQTFIPAKERPSVLHRAGVLVDKWPRPHVSVSAAAYALHGLTGILQSLPEGETIPDRMYLGSDESGEGFIHYAWPPEVAPLDVALWARDAIERLVGGAGDQMLADVRKGKQLPDLPMQLPSGTMIVFPSGCIAVLYLAHTTFLTDKRLPDTRLSATASHHAFLKGYIDRPMEGRGRLPVISDPPPAARYPDGSVRIILHQPGAAVQMTLPFKEATYQEAFLVQLRKLLKPEGLRHYAAWLCMLSINGRNRGSVRYTVDDHMDLLGYNERQRRDPVLRAAAAEQMELFTRIEVELNDPSGKAQASLPIILVQGRLRRRDDVSKPMQLEGLVLTPNELLYNGVRVSATEMGTMWVPFSADLAKVSHGRFPHIHGMGLILAIRLGWRINIGHDFLALKGENLLKLGAFEVKRHDPNRVWDQLRDHLDELQRINAISRYEWTDGAWTTAGTCHIFAPHVMVDRMVYKHIPATPTTIPDPPMTGGMLKTLREARGLSQREMAKILGVNHAAISVAEAKPDGKLGYKLRAAVRTLR